MSDLNPVTNQTNALARGSENTAVGARDSGNQSSLAVNNAIRVVVTQVTTNTVTLSNQQNKQSLQLSTKSLSQTLDTANIKQGQVFDLVKLPNKANTYALVASAINNASSTTTSAISLQQALNGKLPKSVLSNTVSVNDNQLNNVIAKSASAGNLGINGNSVIAIAGRVINIAANQVSISFQIPGSNLPPQQARLTLSPQQIAELKTNSQVQVNVDVSTKKPKVLSINVLSANALGQGLGKTLTLDAQLTRLNANTLPTNLLNAALLSSLLSKQGANSNVASSSSASSGTSAGSPKQVILPLNSSTLSQLPKSLQNAFAQVNEQALTNASKTPSGLTSDNNVLANKVLFLALEPGLNKGSLSVSVIGNLRPSVIELNPVQAKTLLSQTQPSGLEDSAANKSSESNRTQPSKLVSDQQIQRQINVNQLGFISSKADLVGKQSPQVGAALSKEVAQQVNTANSEKSTSAQIDNKFDTKTSGAAPVANFQSDKLLQALQKQVADTLSAISSIQSNAGESSKTSSLLTQLASQLRELTVGSVAANKAITSNLQSITQELGKQSLLLSGSQTQALNNINNAINALLNESLEEAGIGSELRQLLKTVQEQIPKVDSIGTSIDARTIQNLLSTPLNPPPVNAITATAQGGFLSGLVTLLQVSLASKLQRQSNKQASKAQDLVPDLVKSLVPDISKVQSAKLMQDFRQFDSKHALSGEIAKILSSHQHHKLKSADSSLQGQDQLYYALPNLLNPKADDIELLIKRESRENKNAKSEQSASSWYLTMKLDVGELGQMLAKTQLQESEIKLQLFTSTEALKIKALDTLPYLQRRLKSLGIELIEKSCQIGKVPKKLQPEHYHLFEAKV
ncbi:flagellar hook-length control protein FliK [Alteromonas sp. W364]|uniref:flagellar hook-length control protein FliK n=1 Tax=Alteromonas sp. W364 TaxID=3075610 RepID=UPI002886898A|nr:flagellar hook-length control protein FliK [Alteromonas sp. W364]MDT0627717.1 flagellar hook-length control protein FliK [Alteromonas sp. W364]